MEKTNQEVVIDKIKNMGDTLKTDQIEIGKFAKKLFEIKEEFDSKIFDDFNILDFLLENNYNLLLKALIDKDKKILSYKDSYGNTVGIKVAKK